MGLVTAAQSAYDSWKAANMSVAWSSITDAEALALWKQEQIYKQAIVDAIAIEEAFFAARSEAFAAFEATKRSELAALQQLWQAKEDAGFNIDA